MPKTSRWEADRLFLLVEEGSQPGALFNAIDVDAETIDVDAEIQEEEPCVL